MAVPLADFALVEDLFGAELPTSGLDRVGRLIDIASALVRAYARDELEEVPDGVPEVVAGAVVRVLQNPTGATQTTTGPFSASFPPRAAGVYLTAGDKSIIRGLVGRGDGSAFSIDTMTTDTDPVYLGEQELADW